MAVPGYDNSDDVNHCLAMLLLSPLRLFGTRARRSLGAAVVVAALGSTACLPTLPVTGPSATSTAQPAQASSSTIHIGKVVRGDLNGVLNFAAPVQNKGEVLVVPRVIARLDKLDVDIGSRVRVGDVLAELDHSELDQQVLTAQAAQAKARGGGPG